MLRNSDEWRTIIHLSCLGRWYPHTHTHPNFCLIFDMASSSGMREEIREVFRIFDEDESGTITLQELARVLYAILGERPARAELVRLVASAKEMIADQRGHSLHGGVRRTAGRPLPGSSGEGEGGSSTEAGGGGGVDAGDDSTAGRGGEQKKVEHAEEIDVEIFELVVQQRLALRSQEEEMAFTFDLLEDKQYLGYITKDSLKRAAAASGEALTDAEITEMFDALVTGVSTAAVDFATFTAIQAAAQSAEEAD